MSGCDRRFQNVRPVLDRCGSFELPFIPQPPYSSSSRSTRHTQSMKCYYHQQQDAIGTCKSCQRGLCPDCAADFPQGLACRGKCGEDVQSVIQPVQNNLELSPTTTSIIQASRPGRVIAWGFLMIMGIVFCFWGIYETMPFVAALGVVFQFLGVFLLSSVSHTTAPRTET